MPTPFLTALPLFLSPAHAEPPVDTQRVTGNVSTEHSSRAKPVVDACRVTGNVMQRNMKSGPECTIQPVTAGDAPLQFRFQQFQTDGDRCHVSGVLTTAKHTSFCRIGAGPNPVDFPQGRFETLTEEGA